MNNNVKFLVIHHSAVSYTKNPNQWLANNNYHKKKWNSKSSLGYYLGYNYEISSDGIVRQARREGERTIACWQKEMNDGRAIHICLDLNGDIEMPPEAQKRSLTNLLAELVSKYPQAEITTHRAFANKSCPGKLITDKYIKSLNMKTTAKDLKLLYGLIFYREPDADAELYVGHDLEFILNEFQKSDEWQKNDKIIKTIREVFK